MGGGDATLFRASDNLESPYAKVALRQFYIALWRGNIAGWSMDRFENATGLKLIWEGALKEDLPPMPRFLNRLLALPIAEQNELFAELETRIEANIEQAIEAGTHEQGVETIRADSLTVASRETVHVHESSGAATELVEIVRRDRLVPLQAGDALALRDGRPVINTRSKRAAVVLPAPSRMFENGGVEARVRLVRPATREPMAAEELAASNWEDAHGEDSWCTLWDAEIEGLPSHTESRLWLVTGLLLPIWDRLPGENMRVRRLATDAGESLLGRVLTPEQAHAFRDAFGLAGGPLMSSAEMHEAILKRGASFDLANGWRLARRRLDGRRAASRSRGRPTATSRHSNAWAAPPRSSRGGPVCSCPNTSTSAASSNAGRSRLRTRCKPARSRPVSGAGASEPLLSPTTRASSDLRLCAAHCRQLYYLP